MTLQLFDTATREQRDFVPVTPGRVGMYICGLTTQGAPHIGHLRFAVAFDVLRRWLVRGHGYDVTLVRNVTDIDDKILRKAAETDEEWWALSYRNERYTSEALDLLGVLPPTYEPRATGHVPEMVELIDLLVERGHAYPAADGSGDVYFDVRSWADYGELSHQGLDDMVAAEDADPRGKRDPRDFALWKGRKAEEPLAGLAAARERFAGVELVAATDVASPLLGLQGASAVFSEQKGATPEEAQVLEGALGHFADVVRRVLPPGTDLLTGRERRLDREPGAGAAGGVGYALLLLGGRRVSGVETVLSAVGLERLVAAADLVITGEGCLDWQSLQGKVVAGVAELASAHATPAVALAGQVLIGRREAMAMGLAGSYAVADKHADLAPIMADPVGTLADRAERVAATWSPRR